MNDQDKSVARKVIGTIVGLVIIALLISSFVIIGAGQRGVIVRLGEVNTSTVLPEGLHFKLPLVDRIVKMDVTTQKKQVKADSTSQDLQDVFAEVALNYRLDPTKVALLYQTFYQDYDNRFIAPSLQEVIKSVGAEFNAEGLITKRPEVREAIKADLKEKLEPRGILVEEFNIVNFNFSQSFSDAIEAKVTAEQEALEAKNILEKVKYEAQQAKAEAEGKADAIRIEARALRNNPAVLDLRWIEKWDGAMPKYYGGNGQPLINLPGQ